MGSPRGSETTLVAYLRHGGEEYLIIKADAAHIYALEL